ncbi:MAG: hypothetical protein FWF78_03010 [Defluviitaleaceae bacterium]|nr:hypothetical protein [Defluviitaleaceae bacterium]
MNFKRIITLGLVAGMLAVSGTGCSSNTVDRNQGNRNGQRVADAVNHRPDSYNGRGTTRGLFGRTTRGLNRATRNIGTTARDVTDGIVNRYTRTPNRANTFARPHARIGGDYRYEMNHTERGIPRSGMNRAARRANHSNVNRANNVSNNRKDLNNIGLVNDATAPVFFNKKAEPVQPEVAPAPVVPAPAQ